MTSADPDDSLTSHPPSTGKPYADLTPDVVLDALASVGLHGDGRLLQLNSYENRVFQVFLDDGRAVVAKFYRPQRWSDEQILEEHGFAAEIAADEIPLAAPWSLESATDPYLPMHLLGRPPTLAQVSTGDGTHRFAVTECRAGRSPEWENPEVLAWTGRFLGRLHQTGMRRAFRHRKTLGVAEWGTASREWLHGQRTIPGDAAPAWFDTVDRVLEVCHGAFERVPSLRMLRLHGDCHAGNVLWTAAGPHFVDLDDTLTGPAIQDLWMLLSGDPVAARQQLRSLLSGYEDFMEFDDRELTLIEPLRSLRMIHHSAWIARRWQDPAFPAAFPWFGGSAYWSQQTTQLREQLAAMRSTLLH